MTKENKLYNPVLMFNNNHRILGKINYCQACQNFNLILKTETL